MKLNIWFVELTMVYYKDFIIKNPILTSWQGHSLKVSYRMNEKHAAGAVYIPKYFMRHKINWNNKLLHEQL